VNVSGNEQVVVEVTLSGPGVTTANNQALLLRQANGSYYVLMRSGSNAPGVSSGTVL
jgi:hypothetical protein